MALFESGTIQRFSNEAEDIFARDFPCIIDRVALNIVSGTSIYDLPAYVIDIRRVTWEGKKVWPLTHRRYRELNITTSQSGTPTDYIFDNIGQAQIKFFPIPNVSITSTTDNLYGTAINTKVILEFYRMSDYSIYTIPTFFRRRLLKAFVLKQCFVLEGKGKNLKAAKYWENKWNFLKETYGNLLEDLINQPRRIVVGKVSSFQSGILPSPVLPYDSIGIGVNTGE